MLMFALILILLLALVGVAIYTYGVDSRIDEVARRRGFKN
jgi:hypothetical protein